MVQSLIGLDFTEGRQDGPQDTQSPAFDSTNVTTTAETLKSGPESANEHKQERYEDSPLVSLASEGADNTRDAAEAPLSKVEPAEDFLGAKIPAQESSKEDSTLDVLETTNATKESLKEDSLVDLLSTTGHIQDQPKEEVTADVFATTGPTQEPIKKDVTFDRFGVSSSNQEWSSKGHMPSGFLDDLGSPYDWLNQIASRNMRQSEESRATQQEQWSALMSKQEVDSSRIQDFIQKATTAVTTDSASSTSASSRRGIKPKVPFSLSMAIETKDHGRQVLNITDRDDIKVMVERFCIQYDMQSYEMALWVTVAKAIKKKKKRQQRESMRQ
ncbi:hypothetical protein BGZ96_004942 [Linnemannia gamsii]|uniref:Uncharacterized protein n=1 Tax=Linnemannia gamsii TaxID=64522 RepID=A0ABQ7JHV7_9FUNG|nr:hypothetical protein BGZ96_004942 [Linnemannia gamsii]